jgi:hypothetical protein
MAPIIAEALSIRRQLEARGKHLENRLAKASKGEEIAELRERIKEVTQALVAHVVPADPRLYCDDVTPERLANLLAEQGGRMLQASAEGTLFEIVKGRYSEGGKSNMEVYLKGHAGDCLRVQRVSRADDIIERPALSVAVAVQPDVIRGTAEQSTLKHRGFLARWLYAIPTSRVGCRAITPRPVPASVRDGYRECVLRLWRLEVPEDAELIFSAEADREMQELQRWLEPRLAEGEELSALAGWAGKLAGACARIAGVLHLAAGDAPDEEIGSLTVRAAIKLGRDYLLPHAQAAFALMGADDRLPLARRLLRAAVRLVRQRQSESRESSERHPAHLSRRELHQAARARKSLARAEEIDPVLALLVDRYYLRPVGPATNQPGRGYPSPVYELNPRVLAQPDQDGACEDALPVSHYSHYSHRPDDRPSVFRLKATGTDRPRGN